jgi:exonuclease III
MITASSEVRLGNNSITIFHQNICDLKGKTDELISSMSSHSPHILCSSEHHLQKFELDQINVDGYRPVAAYCRQVVKRGGVCIFVPKILKYTNIDFGKYCKEQDIEVCVLKMKSTFSNACTMAVYRVQTGNFNLVLNRLDDIIKTLYKVDLKLIICGDINIDYLTDNDKKRQLDAVLLTYNSSATVHFHTRSQGYSSTAIDNTQGYSK